MSTVPVGRRTKSIRVVRLVINLDKLPYANVHKIVSELGGKVIWRGLPGSTLEVKVLIHKKKLKEFREKIGDSVEVFEVVKS